MGAMSKTVGFEDIGDNIAKRINALYKKKKVVTEDGHGEDLVYDGWFFDGATYKGVKKVEQVLDHLGDLSAANARTEACRVRSKKVVLI
jgi:hypothetical protein